VRRRSLRRQIPRITRSCASQVGFALGTVEQQGMQFFSACPIDLIAEGNGRTAHADDADSATRALIVCMSAAKGSAMGAGSSRPFVLAIRLDDDGQCRQAGRMGAGISVTDTMRPRWGHVVLPKPHPDCVRSSGLSDQIAAFTKAGAGAPMWLLERDVQCCGWRHDNVWLSRWSDPCGSQDECRHELGKVFIFQAALA